MLDTQIVVSIVKDAITGASAATAAIVAIVGLRIWKKQLRGKTEYELAHRLLVALYKVRNSLFHLRSNIIFSGEMEEACKAMEVAYNELDFNNNKQRIDAVYCYRWNNVVETSSEFDAIVIEAEALLGQSIVEAVNQLNSCTRELGINLKIYLSIQENRRQYKEYKKIREIIHKGLEEDKFATNLDTAIKTIEEKIKPYLIIK